ncbi:hypothetical protein V1477_003976 [Vespula maculifrons]|uniref:Uncharacterized protein n=2 Tax=Vespula TaxID=7451 RepID=A0A834NNJ7_VESGE|nr:hypothetical protein HZH68_003123 [Vespula germanica]
MDIQDRASNELLSETKPDEPTIQPDLAKGSRRRMESASRNVLKGVSSLVGIERAVDDDLARFTLTLGSPRKSARTHPKRRTD